MKKTSAAWLLAVVAAFAVASPVMANEKPDGDNANGDSSVPAERQVTTEHSVRIDGETVRYKATAGTLHLRGDDDEARASVFYVAYTRDGVDDAGSRPVTYTFNGGPGSSSVWLHLGAFGPRRVDFADARMPTPPPYELTDNAHSLLDESDLVFIDPVNTGFSRAVGDAKDKEFLGVEEDVKSVYEFIRRWTTENGRWNSPRFLAGESYGTTRAAALVRHAQQRGMFFNGVILVSSILDFQTARFETGNDLPYVLFLPTYAATAWYHEALPERPAELEPFLAEARRFAIETYGPALLKGDDLPDDERRAVVAGLHRFTGLAPDFIRQANLRVSISRFTKELLRDERRSVGRLDSRYLGIDKDAAGERTDHDASYTAILGPYTAAMNEYVRGELGFEESRNYEILSFSVNQQWNWDVPDRAGYINVAEDLREAMSTNTHLKVLVANGYYDLATPFFATEYTVNHMGLEPELRDQVKMTYYPAGHMMYIHPESLANLKDDVATFIRDATGE